jgi:hypothetical protein
MRIAGKHRRAAGRLSAKPLKKGTLKTCKDYLHGMITVRADVINSISRHSSTVD